VSNDRRCPRCGEETLRAWDELGDEEREVVRRLPASVDYEESQRLILHRWCTSCWYESVRGETLA
jgi:hypothetical protein